MRRRARDSRLLLRKQQKGLAMETVILVEIEYRFLNHEIVKERIFVSTTTMKT